MGMSPDNRSTAAITRMGLLAALAALSPATGVATAGMSRVVGIASAAELIDAVENGHDHDKDPFVVKTRYSGVEIDMGSFSRLREINPNSSFGVNG